MVRNSRCLHTDPDWALPTDLVMLDSDFWILYRGKRQQRATAVQLSPEVQQYLLLILAAPASRVREPLPGSPLPPWHLRLSCSGPSQRSPCTFLSDSRQIFLFSFPSTISVVFWIWRRLETATGSHCGAPGLQERGICFKPQGCLFPLHWKDLFVAGIPGIIYGSISKTGSSALHILADAISSHAAASSDNPQL